MPNSLLTKILFFIALAPALGQVPNCPVAKDSIWINMRSPNQIQRYKGKTTFIFELIRTDTVSILIDNKLIAKDFLETTPEGRVIKDYVVGQPLKGKVVIRTPKSCVQFTLKRGYKYIYLCQDFINRWSVVYSNYSKMYF